MQTKLATITNGVDLGRLTETIQAVKASPELAKFQFRIQNRWMDGGENRSSPFPPEEKRLRIKPDSRC